MKYKVHDFTICGKCSQCGSCCSNFLPMTDAEVERLRELVKQPDTLVQIKTAENGKFIMVCPFLIMSNGTRKTRCSIYEHRPIICKEFKCDIKSPNPIPLKMHIVDVMKDIVGYDYQKEAHCTYQEALENHLKQCREDIK